MNAKKTMALFLIMLLLFSSICPTMANENITVKIDGEQLDFDVPPQIINGRTMVPVRKIFEHLGAQVQWDNATSGITAIRNNTKIHMQVNNCEMYVNSEKITLDVGPVIIDSRTLVPVRAVSEALDCYVGWQGDTRTVQILSDRSHIPEQAQGVWRYLYLEKDGAVISKEEATGMDIFKKDFTIAVKDIDVRLTSDNHSTTGYLEYNNGIYTILGMIPSFEANTMKLYNEEEDFSIVLEKTTEESPIVEVRKTVEEKDWVYNATKFEDFYTDSVGNDCYYIYYVPVFNISSDDAKVINDEIYSMVYNYYCDTQELVKTKSSLLIPRITGTYYVNDDIVSLGVEVHTNWDDTYSKWYNMNKATGKRISNSELIASLGYTEDQFIKILKQNVAAYYVDLWENNPTGKDDFYWDRYHYTISDEACNINIPMYVGENGNLWVIANIGSLAGAAHYEHSIDTGIKVCHTAPTFTIGRAVECITLWQNANASLSWMYPLHDNDTIEVVVSEEYNYKEIAKRVMGADTREDVRKDILECVTVEAERKYGVTDTAFKMGGVEHNGTLYAYMPGYGPAFYIIDTAKQVEDRNGYKCVSIVEEHCPDDLFFFLFTIEDNRWKIVDVIEPSYFSS